MQINLEAYFCKRFSIENKLEKSIELLSKNYIFSEGKFYMKLLTANCWQSRKNLFSAITEQGYKSQLQTEVIYVKEKITKF